MKIREKRPILTRQWIFAITSSTGAEKMMRAILGLITVFATLFLYSDEREVLDELILSTPEQTASLSHDASGLIGGVLSPLSGQPVLREIDLVARGAQDVVLSRIYQAPFIPSSFPQEKQEKGDVEQLRLYQHLTETYKGWQFLPHLHLQLNMRAMEVRLTDSNGITLDFKLMGYDKPVPQLCFRPDGITNAAGETPSGKYDPRNTRIYYEEKGNKIRVQSPDGSIRHYYKRGALSRMSILYLLEKELLPSGKLLKYHYNRRFQPSKIESWDPQERFLYASIEIQGNSWDGSCRFSSSTGLKAEYGFTKRIIKGKYINNRAKSEYERSMPAVLASVSSPFYRGEKLDYSDRSQLNSYSGKEKVFSCRYGNTGNQPLHQRVDQLLSPTGANDSAYPVYELSYDPPIAGQKEGSTSVKHCSGAKEIYHYSSKLLPVSIQYFDAKGSLQKEKLFIWDQNQWLQTIEVRGGQKQRLYKKSYEYDAFGNPIREIFTGNLSGSGVEESYQIKRVFSQDARNLLLQEENEEGRILLMHYLPNSNLLTARYTKNKSQILQREFFKYDDCCNLIQTISDDGSGEKSDDLTGVKERKTTTYTLRQKAPFLHMPEWIEEKYLEQGREKLLKKTRITYDAYGNTAKEEVYGSDGGLGYTIVKEYNERGDLLTTTNALGQKATYAYDEKGRLKESLGFSQRLKKEMRYDTNGRLRERKESDLSGGSHLFSYAYDPSNLLIEERDYFQNATRYSYDPLTRKIISTEMPAALTCEGTPAKVATSSLYDPFGREISSTDANGNTTSYRYNAYGSPIEILHPDGGKELFVYEKSGKLKSHTDPDGLVTQFSYDILGRVLSKSYLFEEKILAEESFSYSSFRELTRTNKENQTTIFSYDGAGRKVCEEFCGKRTEFAYNALGDLTKVIKHNGENTLHIEYVRDLLGRLTEERAKDPAGTLLSKIAYRYDADGNRSITLRYVHGAETSETRNYDAFGRLTKQQDACGNIEEIAYDESQPNALGQKVLQVTKKDPNGTRTIVQYDAHGQLAKENILSGERLLSSKEFFYDPAGNLSYQKDHVYEEGLFKKTLATQLLYTPSHLLASTTRAFGSSDAKTTSYTYTQAGKIATKTLPSDLILSYQHHPLGSLQILRSSDGKIHHTITHDNLGRLKRASDEVQKIAIERELDAFGNVLLETFPSGLKIEKTYDFFDRPLTLKYPDGSYLTYLYDSLYLRTILRHSYEDEVLYARCYYDYDLDGNLLSECLIGDLGDTFHQYDPVGREIARFNPFTTQKYSYDSCGNLVHSNIDGAAQTYSYDPLLQLIAEANGISYSYDSLYNRTKKNGAATKLNDLNELLAQETTSLSYNSNGNLFLKQTPSERFNFVYDPLGQLIKAVSEKKKICFTYDPLGRRISKTLLSSNLTTWQEELRENYLYDGLDEIGAYTPENQPKNLKLLGPSLKSRSREPFALEIEGKLFAPIFDHQGNIIRLIDAFTKTTESTYAYTAFGAPLSVSENSPFNPWRYASKRLDPECNLILFGKRCYDPSLGRWLTPDPAGLHDSTNPYQYLFNNPFRYHDPDGTMIAAFVPLMQFALKFAAVALVTKYVSYQLEHQHHHSATERAFNTAIHQILQQVGGISQSMLSEKLEEAKKKKNPHNSHQVAQSSGSPSHDPDERDRHEKPRSNQEQNKQFRDALKDIERKIGREITKDERQLLHREISGRDYGYHDIVEEGTALFKN